MPEKWRTGDAVQIECEGRTVEGIVLLASSNGVSLALGFEALLADHLGMMPVLLGDDGVYRSIVNQTSVFLRKAADNEGASE